VFTEYLLGEAERTQQKVPMGSLRLTHPYFTFLRNRDGCATSLEFLNVYLDKTQNEQLEVVWLH